ncbi:ATP-binding protein [Arcanobacterium hippocoleae]
MWYVWFMESSLISRNSQSLAEEILSDTPVLCVSGARQVGKTTFVRQLIENRQAQMVNLDDYAVLSAAQADPDGFVRQFPQGILAIDEIQRVPSLFRAIKGALEENRRPGCFIVTGSSNLESLRGSEESLAGRAETIFLRGLSQGELRGKCEDFADLIWKMGESGEMPEISSQARSYTRRDYLKMVVTPNYPELLNAMPRRQSRWADAYVQRVLSKDASEICGIQFPDRLERMLNLIASMGAFEFVAAHSARELNIPERSLPNYLAALKDVFLIDVLPAWGANLHKRVISKPKVFLQDSGIAAIISGMNADALELQISSSITRGLVESFVASELLKQQTWSKVHFKMFHFRTSTGKEVDLVLEDRGRNVVGIEVKAAMSLSMKDFSGLKYLQELAGEKFKAGIVLYAGKEILPMGARLWAMPISMLWQAH